MEKNTDSGKSGSIQESLGVNSEEATNKDKKTVGWAQIKSRPERLESRRLDSHRTKPENVNPVRLTE